eukprot:gene2004-1199_t
MSQVSNKPNLEKYIYPSETIKSNNNKKKTSLKKNSKCVENNHHCHDSQCYGGVWIAPRTMLSLTWAVTSAPSATASFSVGKSAGTLIAATHSRVVAAADAMSYGIDLFLPLIIIIVYYLLTSLKNKANRGGKE